jgi:hypothetical protein
MSSTPSTAFQMKHFDLLVQRFLLSLHHPFAVKAMSNPLYYYSRKMCLETSLSLFSHSAQSGDDDFHCLRLCGTGLFRDVYTQSALYMCGQLTDQFETDRPFPTNPGSTFDLREMRNAVDKYLKLAAARIDAGEKNIECYVLVSCLLAQADAMQVGALVEQRISVALRKSLETSYSLLGSQIQDMQDAPLSPTTIGEQLDWSQWDDFTGLNATVRSAPPLISLT